MPQTRVNFKLALGLVLALSGCLGDNAPPPVTYEAHKPPPCPALRKYTITEQQALVKGWNALPPDDIQGVVDTDWERMRAACRDPAT